MDISQLSTSVLKSVLKLTEKRDSLLSELAKVEATITAIYGGKVTTAKTATVPAKRRGRPAGSKSATTAKKRGSRRGALKDSILAALKAAGEKGVGVKDLSKKLGVKNQNVHVWFSSTGRKITGIQKVGPGRYRLKAGAGSSTGRRSFGRLS